MDTFKRLESEVRSYCRVFPTVFKSAIGELLENEEGRVFIDFFSGAGSLNYGHNNPIFKKELIQYLNSNGVIHGLDFATSAKRDFIEIFESIILKPRDLVYKFQFTGPTGTNAVEAALKLARLVKKRSNIIAFSNGYHGLTAGAMAVTGNSYYRNESFVNRLNVSFFPFDGYLGSQVNTIDYLRRFLEDSSSGVDLPAAVIVETIQAEGGVNVASVSWLKALADLCQEFSIILIIDDIQVGCGRTGSFFSFENAGIYPDIVVLSKSLSGIGLPMSLVLLKPEIDQWKPGEHTGTFRGNNLAFKTASKALTQYWQNQDFAEKITQKSELLLNQLQQIKKHYVELDFTIKGRGMIYGLQCDYINMCGKISEEAFKRGVIIELAGTKDNVLKFLPPLNIEDQLLIKGVDIINQSIMTVLKKERVEYLGN